MPRLAPRLTSLLALFVAFPAAPRTLRGNASRSARTDCFIARARIAKPEGGPRIRQGAGYARRVRKVSGRISRARKPRPVYQQSAVTVGVRSPERARAIRAVRLTASGHLGASTLPGPQSSSGPCTPFSPSANSRLAPLRCGFVEQFDQAGIRARQCSPVSARRCPKPIASSRALSRDARCNNRRPQFLATPAPVRLKLASVHARPAGTCLAEANLVHIALSGYSLPSDRARPRTGRSRRTEIGTPSWRHRASGRQSSNVLRTISHPPLRSPINPQQRLPSLRAPGTITIFAGRAVPFLEIATMRARRASPQRMAHAFTRRRHAHEIPISDAPHDRALNRRRRV
jgi:hypothetical protein